MRNAHEGQAESVVQAESRSAGPPTDDSDRRNQPWDHRRGAVAHGTTVPARRRASRSYWGFPTQPRDDSAGRPHAPVAGGNSYGVNTPWHPPGFTS
jgi:hypothetical protein